MGRRRPLRRGARRGAGRRRRGRRRRRGQPPPAGPASLHRRGRVGAARRSGGEPAAAEPQPRSLPDLSGRGWRGWGCRASAQRARSEHGARAGSLCLWDNQLTARNSNQLSFHGDHCSDRSQSVSALRRVWGTKCEGDSAWPVWSLTLSLQWPMPARSRWPRGCSALERCVIPASSGQNTKGGEQGGTRVVPSCVDRRVSSLVTRVAARTTRAAPAGRPSAGRAHAPVAACPRMWMCLCMCAFVCFQT